MNLYSPLTGLDDITLLKTIEVNQLIDEWNHSFNIDITSELQGYNEINLYQCNQTKLRFFFPFDIAGSDKLYEQLEKFDWYYMPRKWEHDVAIKDLEECSEILEVGCGRGAFVERLRKEIGANVQGLEFNKNAIIYAQNAGISVTDQDVHQLANNSPCSFDGICTFQVLEHIPEVYVFLKSLIELLKPSGKLVISVPNNLSFTKYCKNDLLDQPPHHMTQWNIEVFQFLTQIFPIEIKSYSYEPLAEYHIDWYLSIQSTRLPKIALLTRLLNKGLYTFAKPLLKRHSFFRELITGHTIYVCFQKSL